MRINTKKPQVLIGNYLVRKTKSISLLIAALVTISVATAQQEPLYTQYMFNTISVNPGYTGTRNALNAILLSRFQWVGLDGAPRTHTFSTHAPIKDLNMGLGFSVVSDDIGPVSNTFINLNYAYRINLTEKTILSMGIKGGIYNYYAGLQDVALGNNNPDPSFQNNLEQKLQPNAGFGLYLYNDRYYAGFAIPKLIESKLSEFEYQGNVLNQLKRHYYIMAGYVFDAAPEWKIKPSFIHKVVEGAPMSLDITAHTVYKETYWMGATYRIGDAFALLASIQVSKQLMVGYSYDMSTSALASYNNGSHEIVISYDFDRLSKNKVKSPRFF
jgi:type IX secretion system PorP/SprF family membrane protein